MSAAWPRRSRIRSGLPEQVRELAGLLLEQIAGLDEKIRGLEKDVHTSARQDEEAVRLIDGDLPGALSDAVARADADPAVHVMVLSGAGRAFWALTEEGELPGCIA